MDARGGTRGGSRVGLEDGRSRDGGVCGFDAVFEKNVLSREVQLRLDGLEQVSNVGCAFRIWRWWFIPLLDDITLKNYSAPPIANHLNPTDLSSPSIPQTCVLSCLLHRVSPCTITAKSQQMFNMTIKLTNSSVAPIYLTDHTVTSPPPSVTQDLTMEIEPPSLRRVSPARCGRPSTVGNKRALHFPLP